MWPSAGRAWELLHGSKIDLRAVEQSRILAGESRDKRKREDGIKSEFTDYTSAQSQMNGGKSRSRSGVNSIRSNSISGASSAGIDITSKPRSPPQYQPPRTIQLSGLSSSHSSASPTQRPSSLYTQALTSNAGGGGVSPVSTASTSGINTYHNWPNPPTPPSSSSSAPGNGSSHHSPSTMSDNNYAYPSFGVNSSNGYDSKANINLGTTGPAGHGSSGAAATVASDVWKDISEGFGDPALITSSLYGLPVMQGSQATGFMNEFNTMYSEFFHYLINAPFFFFESQTSVFFRHTNGS